MLIIIVFIQALFYLQIWERSAQVVKLITKTFDQVSVFLLIYIVTIMISAIADKVLGSEIENSLDTDEKEHGHEPEYKNINSFMMVMMRMFRNARVWLD